MRSVAGETVGLAVAPALNGGLGAAVRQAADAACGYLLNRQEPRGYWVGELEGDSTLASDYILLQLWLHQPAQHGDWNPPTRPQVEAACRGLLAKQLDDGGWHLFPGGAANVSASVKAYCALKLSGLDSGNERMQRAAARIAELGGAEAANSYTKLYLSYFGLLPRDGVPSIPPEIFLLPPAYRFSVYAMSSWSRAMLAPLSILDARKASRRVPRDLDIREILTGREPARAERLSWKRFFLLLDRAIKLVEAAGIAGSRRKAVRAAEQWMVARLEESDGLGAIFPAMVNSIMALTELGYSAEHPLLQRQIRHLENLVLHDERGFRVQPCHSPVWDTALAAYSIGSARREPAGPTRWALSRAADWLLSKQARRQGDWAVRNPEAEPGGWYFEFANEFYPDADDTAKVLLALEWAQATDPARQQAAEQRGLEWLARMQSSDGGWAAFDIDNSAVILTQVPFADHNAMLDPTCADITGRALEALARRGCGRYPDALEQGAHYLLRAQESDGCWYGRWGVNYLYGTCFALRGLRAAGVGPHAAAVIRAGEWVRSLQNPDGGWGESPVSYDDPACKGAGDSTPSQTAWALLALFATDDYETGAVAEGLQYLLDRQTPQGTWSEEAFTGTGFPSVFYLRYHMYPQYFPLMAFGEYLHRAERRRR